MNDTSMFEKKSMYRLHPYLWMDGKTRPQGSMSRYDDANKVVHKVQL